MRSNSRANEVLPPIAGECETPVMWATSGHRSRMRTVAVIGLTAICAACGGLGSCERTCRNGEGVSTTEAGRGSSSGSVHFRSSLPLEIYVGRDLYGQTPSGEDIEVPSGSLWMVRAAKPIAFMDLRAEIERRGVPGLVWGNIADTGLSRLRDLPALRALRVEGNVTEGDLRAIEGSASLESLDLGGVNVRAGGLAHVRGLKCLRYLRIDGSSATDADLSHIGALTGLQELDLSETQITDEGLGHLSRLAGLRVLKLRGTRVTGVGLASVPSIEDLVLNDCARMRATVSH